MRGSESYHLLESLSDIISKINTLITSSSIDGLKLDIVFDGDYNVSMNALHIYILVRQFCLLSVSAPCYGYE